MQIDTTLLPVRGDDAVEILRHDHRVIKSLLTELTSEAPQERKRVFEQLVGVLTIHNATEENLIYPAINKLGGGKEESQHLYHETADADVLAFELDALLKAGDVSQFGVKAEKFAEAVLAHIDEEESNALPRLLEVGDPRKVEELAEAVRTFRKSLHFETATCFDPSVSSHPSTKRREKRSSDERPSAGRLPFATRARPGSRRCAA